MIFFGVYELFFIKDSDKSINLWYNYYNKKYVF